MNITRRNVDNDGIHHFYFDDDDVWVAITPSSHSWEWEKDNDDDTYVCVNYVTDGNTVIDYDGIYELPVAVILALSDMGFDIDL